MMRVGLRMACFGLGAAAAGCGFSGTGTGDDQGDDGDPGDTTIWRLDSEADFRAPGAWLDDATAIAPGSVAVGRYAHGALAAAGRGGCGIATGEAATITWSDMIAAMPAGRGFGNPSLPLTGGTPAGLGLGGDTFTVWWEGELWLEAGAHELAIDADDRAFVEVMVANGTWQRVSAEGAGAGTIPIAASDWYPVRIAHAECGAAEALAIRHRPPGASEAVPLSEARMRAVVNGQSGLTVTAYDDRALLVPVGMSAATGINADWGAGHPADLGITTSNTYSLRWSGQLRIDVAGTYRLRVASDNGHRLRIDGAVVLDHMSFGATTEDRTTTDLVLAAGWHDLVLDYQEDAGTARIALTVAAGPELVGRALPADRLRPMPGLVGRVVSRAESFGTVVPDHQVRTFPLRVDAPAGATVDRVNIGYAITHAYPDEVIVRLTSPAGTEVVLRDRVPAGPIQDRFVAVEEFAGQPAAGVWTLAVEDVVTNDTGTVNRAALTVHYAGGPPAQAAAATYLSEVKALGSARELVALRWEATTPGASTVALAIRGCSAPEACTGAFTPVAASGDAPAIDAAPYVQLRAVLTPSGDDAPTLDALELAYR